jgi:hypothetical protein
MRSRKPPCSRKSCGFAALEEVFFAGARCLDHLVDRPVASAEELVCEMKGEVIDDFRLLKGKQGLVISSRRNQPQLVRVALVPPFLPISPMKCHKTSLGFTASVKGTLSGRSHQVKEKEPYPLSALA